jgi:hypothetical protein
MAHRAAKRDPVDPELIDLVAWRYRRLEQAGFDAELAQVLAGDRRYDLHAALELVDRGCPPQFAARILAPLDETQGVER